MRVRRGSSLWMGALVAALLWLASGAISSALSWNGVLGGSIGGILPATQPLYIWAQPQPWPVASAIFGGVAVAVTHRAITRISAAEDRRRLVVVVWFAAIAAGGLVGLAADIAIIFSSLPPARAQMLLNGLGTSASVGAYWGLVQGWIPAVLVSRFGTADVSETPTSATWPRRHASALIAGAAVLALVAFTATGIAGLRAARTVATQQEAISNGFDDDSGALPDPYAEGTPVPSIAPDGIQPAPDWCVPEQAMLLLGDRDAATGHRSYSIRLMNFSDEPCVIEGYPDIAFADQNNNALDVTVEDGGSFMATDPGAARIEIPAGGAAIAYLGWNANSTDGVLIASTMYAAPFAGETRGSWPITSDIIEGATVAVTAWALADANTTGEP